MFAEYLVRPPWNEGHHAECDGYIAVVTRIVSEEQWCCDSSRRRFLTPWFAIAAHVSRYKFAGHHNGIVVDAMSFKFQLQLFLGRCPGTLPAKNADAGSVGVAAGDPG